MMKKRIQEKNLKLSPQSSPRDEAYVNKKQLTALLRGILISRPRTCSKLGRTWDEMWVKRSSVTYSLDAASSQINTGPRVSCWVGCSVKVTIKTKQPPLSPPSHPHPPSPEEEFVSLAQAQYVRITQFYRMRIPQMVLGFSPCYQRVNDLR